MARGDQLGRQWKIIQSLLSGGRGLSVAELARKLKCHPRTVYRDLEALQIAGFPIYTERSGNRSLWSVLDTFRGQIPLPLNLAELMALYFSRDMLKVLKDTVYHEALNSLFDKIKASLPPHYMSALERIEKSLYVGPKPYKQYGRLQTILAAVNEALLDGCYIEIRYFTMSRREETRRRVAPYKIWYFDGTFYLIGYCCLRREVRVFAVDRIRDVTPTDRNFDPPETFDIEAFMRTSFGVFRGATVKVRVWFAAEAAGYVQEKVWHVSQHIEKFADGSIIFEAEVAGTDEIKFWILSWGAKARVLEPASLRESITREAARMTAAYAEAAPGEGTAPAPVGKTKKG